MTKTKENKATTNKELEGVAMLTDKVAEKPNPQVIEHLQKVKIEMAASRYCCFRITGSEDSKINAIALATFQEAGMRATTTDILRVALKRLPEKAITREEIASLRAEDKRRRQS